ncbi:MAG: ribosome-binding factor A [Deltaproteobacteria bacterium]|jgi:ribosome-binding factor A|nr:ribosome-binding factor A [Deltaproteobacteria bacterium]
MFRKERVSEVLLGFLAQAVRELEDARLMLVTITDVRVSSDLKYAQVFWSMPIWNTVKNGSQEVRVLSFPNPVQQAQLNKIFDEYKNNLKSQIAKELNLRYTPELYFEYDFSEEQGTKIDRTIDNILNNQR